MHTQEINKQAQARAFFGASDGCCTQMRVRVRVCMFCVYALTRQCLVYTAFNCIRNTIPIAIQWPQRARSHRIAHLTEHKCAHWLHTHLAVRYDGRTDTHSRPRYSHVCPKQMYVLVSTARIARLSRPVVVVATGATK